MTRNDTKSGCPYFTSKRWVALLRFKERNDMTRIDTNWHGIAKLIRAYVISFRVISCHFIWCHSYSCQFISCHSYSCQFVSVRVIPIRVKSCQFVSVRVNSCQVVSVRPFFSWSQADRYVTPDRRNNTHMIRSNFVETLKPSYSSTNQSSFSGWFSIINCFGGSWVLPQMKD